MDSGWSQKRCEFSVNATRTGSGLFKDIRKSEWEIYLFWFMLLSWFAYRRILQNSLLQDIRKENQPKYLYLGIHCKKCCCN